MIHLENSLYSKKFTFSTITQVAPSIPLSISTIPNQKEENTSFCDTINWACINDNTKEKIELPDISFTAQGGILADEMGLGKTATVIALIANLPRKINRKQKKYIPKKKKIVDGVEYIKTTLIVCPSQLVSQWGKEISKVSSLTYKCGNTYRDYNVPDIRDYDVLIVSHSAFFNYKNKNEHTAVFQKYGWHRIILDEGHQVLSEVKKENEAIPRHTELWENIHSDFNWYVSGTPVPLGRASLIGMMKFLRIHTSEYEPPIIPN